MKIPPRLKVRNEATVNLDYVTIKEAISRLSKFPENSSVYFEIYEECGEEEAQVKVVWLEDESDEAYNKRINDLKQKLNEEKIKIKKIKKKKRILWRKIYKS